MKNSLLKTFQIRPVDLQNEAAVVAFLRKHFNRDEPTLRSKLLSEGFNENDQNEIDQEKVTALRQNLSLFATEDNKQIAGLQINEWISKDMASHSKIYRHSQSTAVAKLFQKAREKADLFNRFNVDKLFAYKLVVVDSKYRGSGVAMKFFEASEKLARSVGAKVLISDATSAYSAKIHDTFEWDIGSEVMYNDFLDENGNPIIVSEEPHVKYQFRYKVLS